MTLGADLGDTFSCSLDCTSQKMFLFHFIISFINMVFQVYKSFSVKFCTIMTFQGGLIKFGIFGSVLSREPVTILRLYKACSRV